MTEKKYERTCLTCGKLEMVSTQAQLARLCRSCSKKGNTSSQNLSVEAREKMSAAKRGKTPWNKGKTDIYSEETLDKMGAQNRGKEKSEATLAKVSDSLRKYYATHEHHTIVKHSAAPKPDKEPALPVILVEARDPKLLTLDEIVEARSGRTERAAAALLGVTRIAMLNQQRKLLGVCIQCAEVAPKPDCTRCEACLVKAKGNKTKEEKSEYNQQYWDKNKEKLAFANKTYQMANLDKFRKYGRAYDKTPAGKISARLREVRRNSLEDVGMPTFDSDLLFETIVSCENCSALEDLTLDHHIPLTKGGQQTLTNTNLLCRSCNSSKHDASPADFFGSMLPRVEEKFRFFDLYTEVESPKSYEFNPDPDKRKVKNFISYHHYKCTSSNVSFAMTLEYAGRVIGAAIFGPTSRQDITVDGNRNIRELSRFFVLDGTPKNTESYFLSQCLRWLQKNTEFDHIVTFADTTEGHRGGIYKACNFVERSITSENYHYESKVDSAHVHKRRVWDRAKENGVSEAEQALAEGLERVKELPKIKFSFPLK